MDTHAHKNLSKVILDSHDDTFDCKLASTASCGKDGATMQLDKHKDKKADNSLMRKKINVSSESSNTLHKSRTDNNYDIISGECHKKHLSSKKKQPLGKFRKEHKPTSSELMTSDHLILSGNDGSLLVDSDPESPLRMTKVSRKRAVKLDSDSENDDICTVISKRSTGKKLLMHVSTLLFLWVGVGMY